MPPLYHFTGRTRTFGFTAGFSVLILARSSGGRSSRRILVPVMSMLRRMLDERDVIYRAQVKIKGRASR